MPKIRTKKLASKPSEPIGQLYVESIDHPSVDGHKYPRDIFLQRNEKMRQKLPKKGRMNMNI
jgi:hypothetical protein